MNIKEYQGSQKKHNKDTKKSNYEPTMNINGNVKGKYKPSQYNSLKKHKEIEIRIFMEENTPQINGHY